MRLPLPRSTKDAADECRAGALAGKVRLRVALPEKAPAAPAELRNDARRRRG